MSTNPLPASLPASLAGYQNILEGVVQAGDICIPDFAAGPVDWQWAGGLIGYRISGGVATFLSTGFRIYRKMPVPKPGDNDVNPATGKTYLEGRTKFVPNPHDVLAISAESVVKSKIELKSDKAATYDDGKPPLAQLPWAALDEMAHVQAYGHKKYGDFYNYRKGMEVSRQVSCAIRHLRDYMNGHDKDHESGLNPLAHAMTRIGFLLQNIADGKAIDDRFKG